MVRSYSMSPPDSRRVRHPWVAFLAARFSPQGAFGLQLTLGVAAILLVGWTFGEVAEDVVSGAAITRLDVRLAQWFHSHATPGFTRAMLVVTHANGLAGAATMTALLALWFRRRGLRDWMLLTLVAGIGGAALNVALKHVFHRARPHFDDPLLTLDTFSFPSGHTAAATVLYGLVAWWFVTRARTWPQRVPVVAAAACMVALVALSRMYLGAHYLSDVLAATLESVAWLAVCITATSTYARMRRLRGERTARGASDVGTQEGA
jgi:undecaprenyl-diphosphatase